MWWTKVLVWVEHCIVNKQTLELFVKKKNGLGAIHTSHVKQNKLCVCIYIYLNSHANNIGTLGKDDQRRL